MTASSGRASSANSTPACRRNTSGSPCSNPKGPAIDGLHIRGLYLHNDRRDQVVSDFVANLRQSKFFKLDANDKTVILNRAGETEKDWAFDYELQLNLAQPHPLQ